MYSLPVWDYEKPFLPGLLRSGSHSLKVMSCSTVSKLRARWMEWNWGTCLKSPGFWGEKRHLSCNVHAWFLTADNFSLHWKPRTVWSRNTLQPQCPGTCDCPSRSCNKLVCFSSQVLLSSTICAKLLCAPRCFITQKLEDEKMKCQIHVQTVGCFFSLLSFILIIDPKSNLSSKRNYTYTRCKPFKINWTEIYWVILTCPPNIFNITLTWCLSFKWR